MIMLETKSGSNPICIGPGILHKRKLETSYYALPSLMVKYNNNIKGVLVYGTDGEANISSAMCNVFPDAVHLRCDLHLKDNARKKLTELGIDGVTQRDIMKDIFGCELEGTREGGLVDCTSEEEYDKSLELIKTRWPPKHSNAETFLNFFLKEQIFALCVDSTFLPCHIHKTLVNASIDTLKRILLHGRCNRKSY